jgi:hypothetical protein
VLPKLEYSKTVGKWTFDSMGEFAVTSDKAVNAPNYGVSNFSLKLTYQVADAAKVWVQGGDGAILKPGFSYAFGPVTAQLEIPLGKDANASLFVKPVIRLEPKVSYAASGIGASLKAVFALADITQPDGTIAGGDDWDTYKQNEKTSVLQGLEFAGSYTGGPVKAEVTVYFPLYANWALDPTDADIGILGGFTLDKDAIINGKGITIEPKITYTISAVALYAKVKIGNIGIHSDLIDAFDGIDKKLGVSIAPTVGVTYAF